MTVSIYYSFCSIDNSTYIISYSFEDRPKEVSVFINNTSHEFQELLNLFAHSFETFSFNTSYEANNISDNWQIKNLPNVKSLQRSIQDFANRYGNPDDYFNYSIYNTYSSIFDEVRNVVEYFDDIDVEGSKSFNYRRGSSLKRKYSSKISTKNLVLVYTRRQFTIQISLRMLCKSLLTSYLSIK